ncbi:MAG: glycosyltransferase family 1 protein [Microbacteriaceae bacterium]|jgi:glycosyltransferase involved in cell wall biosynthesis|nr:glycosyltransferase family 1 protein [Microbacteriaceae bacterium]
MPDARILINGSFRGQRITGQQRYATEIAGRLLSRNGVRERALDARAQSSPIRAWARAQLAGFGRSRNERLLTLTSRGPVVGRRHVVVVHDLFVLDHPEWFSRRYVATHAPILRAQLRSAELVVAVSDPVARRTMLLTGQDTPVVTVPNAPAEFFRPGLADPDALAANGLRRGGYVLAVSSDDPRKNLGRLIAAHARLPESLRRDFPLVLAGGSSAIFARSERGYDDTLRLGYVDDHELARLYSAAAIVAFPSLDEGFGLPAVEALASGADILVSDVPVLHWVCGEDANYADPLSVLSISDTLRSALEKPTTQSARVERAEAVRRRFSWDDSADILYAAISTLSDDAR